ncbi:MAG: 3-isopropylmalate dehydrogenase [Methylobacteriaceae bacterium]|nr:3-isopropylmalate dehydrogenase [Methylobacteriaceae bacterium]
MENTAFDIAVLPGDGIGAEVIDAAIPLIEKAARGSGFTLRFTTHAAGALHYKEAGEALPSATLEACRNADAILFGAMGWPDIRYPDGTEIAPQLDLRFELDLYAGVRPARAIPGVPLPLASPCARNIDLALVRENTEGLFASRGKGVRIDGSEARDTMIITRKGSQRVHKYAFELAGRRARAKEPKPERVSSVVCVDKANVFVSLAFFREVFDEVARDYPTIAARHQYVDAAALDLIRRPWDYDVLVTENMFGDILSDEIAGLIGGMGMAPSADIGDWHALFQPCHGSAPDIAGRGQANPTAMILSAAMMLEWLGERSGNFGLVESATKLTRAVDAAFACGHLLPYELGGNDGTRQIASAVLSNI